MTLLLKGLHFIITHISSIVQSCLLLIGSLLVLIPIYQFLAITDKHTLKNFSQSCIDQLGLQDIILSPYSTATSNSEEKPYNDELRSVSSSVAQIVTDELNPSIDTQVCLLQESSSSMVAGLINIGNTCFLNSVLQSLSSLPKLQHYLGQLSTAHSASRLPVTQSLLKTLRLLSQPSNNAFKPTDIVNVLGKYRNLLNREQQDAQEIYQLLVNELDSETDQLEKKQGGLRDLLSFGASKKTTKIKNPLKGRMADKRSCTVCGYSGALRLEDFSDIQLALPTDSASTTLDECLTQLTKVDVMEDVDCMKCSLVNRAQELATKIESLQQQGPKKSSEIRRIQDLKTEIEHRLNTGDIEREGGDPSIGTMIKRAKSKQSMFSKPPKVLCLHFVRSVYTDAGETLKNECQVVYPEMLDLTPYCTNGRLQTEPHLPISTPDHGYNVKYRLMSSIIHKGRHSYGHFVSCKRRLLAENCSCADCGHADTTLKPHDSDWFIASDSDVGMMDAQDVLKSNPFMLFYELIEERHSEEEEQEDSVPELIHTPVAAIADQQQQQQQVNYWEESESDQDDLEELLSSNKPAAPPSSPIMDPFSTYTKKPNRKNVNSNRLKFNHHHSIPILTQ
ncbi:cysteine proteinase [Mucor ambiguus]|uniref:ubiquitinyl hydrolase 1 n=1 Tax=Mucor ambiguus TaxID=91626 RepID=A0A0C9M0I7_9FUNG|nr:cysteine proteinase [Mucor ambiguus]